MSKILSIVIVLVLVIGVIVGVVLVRQTQIFKPQASTDQAPTTIELPPPPAEQISAPAGTASDASAGGFPAETK